MNIQPQIADLSPQEQRAQAYHTPEELVRFYGSHTLALIGLGAENRHFLVTYPPDDMIPGGAGLVNYRLVRNVAVVLGNPVCAPEAFEQVTRSFLDFCSRQHWRVAFYQASPEHLATYRSLRLRVFKMGEEALLHPQTFTLSGSALANVRTSCRRAEREGVRVQWYEGVPPLEVIQQLKDVSNAWLERKADGRASEMGFSTGRLDELIDTAEQAEKVASVSSPANTMHTPAPRLVTAVATTSAGQACAFVTFIPIFGALANEATTVDRQPEVQGWGWTLDLMRRVADAPPGVMELLLVRSIERFRSCGGRVVSVGMVAMADTRQEMTPVERRLASFVTDRLGLFESRRTLFNFKQKFNPHWESRYLITNTTLGLPKIALAVLRLRHYSGGGWVRLIMRLLRSFGNQ